MNRIINLFLLIVGFLLAGSLASAQTPAPQVQHFVVSTTAGSFGGSAVSIASTGIQLTSSVSVVYEYIVNPTDSTKPRVGSGVANYTFQLSRIVPKSIKSKLLIDLTNYNLTLQGGGGRESLFNGIGNARTYQTVGNFGVFLGYPLPGGHVQVAPGYKWVVGKQGGLVHVPNANLTFTF